MKEEILTRLQALVAEQFSVETDSITEETSFAKDLGADSVDLMELVMAIEEDFGIEEEIPEEVLPTLKTVGDVVRFLEESGQ